MKKFVAAVLALSIVAGVAAPTFAAQADTTCKYKNEAFCGPAQSLADLQDDVE